MARKTSSKGKAKKPEMEHKPFSKLLKRSLAALHAEHMRVMRSVLQEGMEDMGIQDEGWQVDLQNARFVRPKQA